MASTSETGHAKNVTNFEQLVSLCKGYSSVYNPSNPAITIKALELKLADAKAALSELNTVLPTLTIAINNRENLFADLNGLVSRINSATAAIGGGEALSRDVKTISNKLKGVRAVKTKAPQATGENAEAKNVSVSQMSFDNRLENFDKLIALLDGSGVYLPNETELMLAALKAKLADMRTANTAVIDAYTVVSNTRIKRNEVLYSPLAGMVQTAAVVKNYVKSIFGVASPKTKELVQLKFKTA